jgi:hypothetical protein
VGHGGGADGYENTAFSGFPFAVRLIGL